MRQPRSTHPARRIVEYDSLRHRVWILGQRCHHGATGTVLATAACLVLAAEREGLRALAALAVAGGALMAHDWSDHAIWFERGYGSQA